MDSRSVERIIVTALVFLFLFSTKKFILEIVQKVLDSFKYFIAEEHGTVTQKLNAALGFTLVIIILFSFGGFLYKYLIKDFTSQTLLVLLGSCLLFFIPVLIFCERYTRHRYRKG